MQLVYETTESSSSNEPVVVKDSNLYSKVCVWFINNALVARSKNTYFFDNLLAVTLIIEYEKEFL